MSYSRDKLAAFEQAVEQEAEQKIKQLQEEAKAYREQELEKAKGEEYAKMFDYMQEQVQVIKNRQKQAVTKYDLKVRRGLVKYRNQLTDKIFDEAKEKLTEFSHTEEYADYLLGQVKAAMEEFPFDTATVLLKKEDLTLADSLKKQLSGKIEVEEDSGNRLGGFILFNKEHGVLTDKTFAAVLEEQKQGFYSTCGLTIQY
ncbi:MAG: hypothetical protein HP058_03965 [Massilimaliae sp.]|nr:hypothetical protein [Massiliimalia sp.]